MEQLLSISCTQMSQPKTASKTPSPGSIKGATCTSKEKKEEENEDYIT